MEKKAKYSIRNSYPSLKKIDVLTGSKRNSVELDNV